MRTPSLARSNAANTPVISSPCFSISVKPPDVSLALSLTPCSFCFASASPSTLTFATRLAPVIAILLIPIPDLLPLGLAIQVVKRLELPPLRYVHEFPRLAIAILRYLEAHQILRWLPIRAIGSDPSSQRDPFKACI